ncbi:MAG: hypoxanthine phosphoribosyltransferase [Candidatus Cloacimonetes bacterium]|nr:hypoxanthine phosphoribosyltransferase [Candidatus Cloacimonadota bacterium]
MNNDLSAVLFEENVIRMRIRELGTELSKVYAEKNPVLICVLRGAVVFLTDLMRHITIPLEIDFMGISSYGASAQSSGSITVKNDINIDIKGRHVIIVEDIVDTGLSLRFLIGHLDILSPASIATCVLLDKPEAHKIDIHIDYVGFEIGNDFVVGFGLDFNEKYRNLPYVGILKEEVYIEP